jgi:hypothetical protein
MCVVAAKHFKDIGWVLAKNRDQDYVPDIRFQDEKTDGKELFVLHDMETGYKEGMNYKGLTIITASLTPTFEHEANLDKKDGIKIHDVLDKESDPEKAAKILIGKQMTGFIFIANKDKLVLIEAARTENGTGIYRSKMRVVPYTETVVRTNHGVEFEWAGFQFGYTEAQDERRKGSISRLKFGEKIIQGANTPIEMMDVLASKCCADLQMNVFRVENKPKQMRTIFQWALVPSHDLVYVRPIQAKMKLHYTKGYIEMKLVDNTIIQKLYDGRLKHLTKIKTTDDGKFVRFVSEATLSFKNFIGET